MSANEAGVLWYLCLLPAVAIFAAQSNKQLEQQLPELKREYAETARPMAGSDGSD